MHIDEAKLNQVFEQAFSDLVGAQGGFMVSLGAKLGLYKAMDGAGPLHSHEIAAKTDCAERYVREWLGSQVAAQFIDYDPVCKTYQLTPEQALVFARQSSPQYMASVWDINASLWFDEAKTLDAFRTGKGVAWAEHHGRMSCGVAAFFRNAYETHLVQDWLPALDGVVEELRQGIRVADIGCGFGHSTVTMAQAFPNSEFVGFDTHEESLVEARSNLASALPGSELRVSFENHNAANTFGDDEGYDLICFFDCLHDMGRPVDALRSAGKALRPGGAIMLVEPAAGNALEDNVNPVGRLYYAGSTALCCAHAISEQGTHVLGAQAGPVELESVFEAAGFSQFRVATQTAFNLILEARL